MPGRNHTVEAGFLDALPNSQRPAAADLLHYYHLKQLVEMRKTGVLPELESRFELTGTQWLSVLDAVILTKVSYFDVSINMSPRHINKLLEITSFALHKPGASLGEIYKQVEKDYTFFAGWLKQVHSVRMNLVKAAREKGLLNKSS